MMGGDVFCFSPGISINAGCIMNSLEKVFSFVWAASFLFIAPHLYADKLDSVAEKARNATGKENITCSLNGDEKGAIPYNKIAGELKDKAMLTLLPDRYPSTLVNLNKDQLIIKGSPELIGKSGNLWDKEDDKQGDDKEENESGGGNTFQYKGLSKALPCPPVYLNLEGRDNTVRDFTGYLRVHSNVTIVDSILLKLFIIPENTKTEINLINCAVFNLESGKTNGTVNINMKNCTVSSFNDMGLLICLRGQVNLDISNSIIFSAGRLFKVDAGKGKLKLKDTILMSKKEAVEKYGDNGKNRKTAPDLKSLKKIFRLSADKNSQFADPMFAEEASYGVRFCPIKCLRLQDDSPGKKLNAGVNLSEENFPVPPGKEKAKQGE